MMDKLNHHFKHLEATHAKAVADATPIVEEEATDIEELKKKMKLSKDELTKNYVKQDRVDEELYHVKESNEDQSLALEKVAVP